MWWYKIIVYIYFVRSVEWLDLRHYTIATSLACLCPYKYLRPKVMIWATNKFPNWVKMNSFYLGTEEQPIWHYCMVHNSWVAQCRSSKPKSEEAGITRRWYHQSQLTTNTWFSIYRIIIINANSYSQYLTSKQVLGLRIFLTQPGRSLNAGYSWPRGFPPRSKWTYGEVFYPAVVPQPPFSCS